MVTKRRTHTSKVRRKKKFLELFVQFIKLQLAGNVPFWGTYLLYAYFDQATALNEFSSLLTATIIANIAFFIINDRWVFSGARKHKKTRSEIVRFVTFMSFSSIFTFTITWLLYDIFGITPYIGQFITAALSTLLTFAGLRFWVFAPRHKSAVRRTQRSSVRQ